MNLKTKIGGSQFSIVDGLVIAGSVIVGKSLFSAVGSGVRALVSKGEDIYDKRVAAAEEAKKGETKEVKPEEAKPDEKTKEPNPEINKDKIDNNVEEAKVVSEEGKTLTEEEKQAAELAEEQKAKRDAVKDKKKK